jgi:hypothetical protein
MAPSKRQLDLLLDWEPPAATVRFEPQDVRAASLAHLVSRGVSAALKGTPLSREEIAKRMGEYLGCSVGVNILNRYASPESEEHAISMVRFIALLHATRDRRLLEMIAEMMGWTVIERKYLPMIELAAVRERERELKQHGDALRRKAMQEGAL